GVGYAIETSLQSNGMAPTVAQVIVVAAVGSLVGALPRLVVDQHVDLEAVAFRVVNVAVMALLLRFARGWFPASAAVLPMVGILAVLVVSVGAQLLLRTVLAYQSSGGRLRALLRDEAHARMPFYLFWGLLAVMTGLSVHVVGLAGLVLVIPPIAATQIAILRWSAVRATRLDAVRSLSRIPELGGYVEPGHSRRVGDLAVDVARDLGMPEARRRRLQIAAIMHDVGQISLATPVPGGTTSLLEHDEQVRIARLGADVIKEGGPLDDVATFVEHSADRYRRPDGRRDPSVPLESRIIKVANTYDDFVGASPDPEVQLQAIERMELDISTGYDPEVTAALGRVVERRQRVPIG
ncbi:MAG: HD domain-containing protein, partial [Acidothermales bacterium]|nr:HD domain-containing protein [Acidothermales bacterium]